MSACYRSLSNVDQRSRSPIMTRSRTAQFSSGGAMEELTKSSRSQRLDEPKRGGRHAPPMTCDSDEDDYEEQCRDCAVPALAYYNQFVAPGDGGVAYTMVDFGWSNAFFSRSFHGSKYHCNFTARPCYSNGPPMLFFAEVGKKYNQDESIVFQCKRLGLQGSVSTGLNGCWRCAACAEDPLHHPLDGDFDAGSSPYAVFGWS